nr:NADH dehydrogenase subunit 3 [Thlaspida biramosa]
MKLIMSLMMIPLVMIFGLTTMLNMLSKKSFYDKEKNSPFECGFDPKSNSRIPFSIQFFLIAIIFLVFDVEIILLLPMIKIIKISNLTQFIWSLNSFLVILVVGFFHELNQGALKWLN